MVSLPSPKINSSNNYYDSKSRSDDVKQSIDGTDLTSKATWLKKEMMKRMKN